MPHFLVIARDGTDAQAPARRQAARDAHLAGVMQSHAAGEMVAGGALLDEAGGMVGSAVIMEFPSRAELDAWIAKDPYVAGKVWQHIEVLPLRLAVPQKAAPAAAIAPSELNASNDD